MPLLNCSDCSNEYSDSAAACPKCGAPNFILHLQSIINLLVDKSWEVVSREEISVELFKKDTDRIVGRVTKNDWIIIAVLAGFGIFIWPLWMPAICYLIYAVVASFFDKTIKGESFNMNIVVNSGKFEFAGGGSLSRKIIGEYCTANKINYTHSA